MDSAGSHRVQWQTLLYTVIILFRFYRSSSGKKEWSYDSTPACAFMTWTGAAPLFLRFYKSRASLLPAKLLSAFHIRLPCDLLLGQFFSFNSRDFLIFVMKKNTKTPNFIH
jgi:hypothetical protein